MRRLRLITGLTFTLAALLAGGARAATSQSIGSFVEPIYLTSDPGNANRLFVVERAGRVVEVEGGARHVFADVTSVVSCAASCVGERGLLSIALAPDFDSSGRFFLDYAENDEPGDLHVAEMKAIGNEAPLASLRDILTIPHPNHANHNGGQLQIGPEGNLFVSTGDGGGSDDEEHNAQDLDSALGKILRLDPDPSGALPYTVPAGNPFTGTTYPRNLIWSYGLRNPFRFSFDRAGGDLWIGDVGQSGWEEVDRAEAPGSGRGENFGWNCREGFEPGPATDPGCTGAAAFAAPVFAYPHADPGGGGAWGCAIIGGYVARDPGIGEIEGRYVYGDLCSGAVRSFCPADPAGSDRSEGLRVSDLNSFGEDSAGRLYAVSGGGSVYRLGGSGSRTCVAAEPPPPLGRSFVGIHALRNKVKRHRRALISVWVAPCNGRVGDPVTLWRGRFQLGTRHLDRVCSVRFRPRVDRRSRFRATIEADSANQAAISRKVTIRIAHRVRRHRRPWVSSAPMLGARWR